MNANKLLLAVLGIAILGLCFVGGGVAAFVVTRTLNNSVAAQAATVPTAQPGLNQPLASAQGRDPIVTPASSNADGVGLGLSIPAVYSAPDKSFPLIDKGVLLGVSYDITSQPPYRVYTPYRGVSTIALGNGKVGNVTTASDGTQGSVIPVFCDSLPGCWTTIDNYSAGNVNVTTIFAGREDPQKVLLDAVTQMFGAPNCGQSGCPTVFLYNGKDVAPEQTFTAVPDSVGVTVPWTNPVNVSTIVVAKPPSNAEVLTSGKTVVGHKFVVSGNNKVSIPEGGGGTIFCFPNGGMLDGETMQANDSKVINGTPSDGATPEDLNRTVSVSGHGVIVQFVYLDDMINTFADSACHK